VGDKERIGDLIKKYRKQKKMTQEMLARKVGISKNGLWNYENNVRDIPASTLEKIALTLDVSVGDLLGASDGSTRDKLYISSSLLNSLLDKKSIKIEDVENELIAKYLNAFSRDNHDAPVSVHKINPYYFVWLYAFLGEDLFSVLRNKHFDSLKGDLHTEVARIFKLDIGIFEEILFELNSMNGLNEKTINGAYEKIVGLSERDSAASNIYSAMKRDAVYSLCYDLFEEIYYDRTLIDLETVEGVGYAHDFAYRDKYFIDSLVRLLTDDIIAMIESYAERIKNGDSKAAKEPMKITYQYKNSKPHKEYDLGHKNRDCEYIEYIIGQYKKHYGFMKQMGYNPGSRFSEFSVITESDDGE
jgi:transcriptional regulator with XRE-family HTH domain